MITLTFSAPRLFIVGFLFLLSNVSFAFEDVLINDCLGLQNMNLDLAASYIVTNDIDCRATELWNGGAGFIPVGSSSSEGFCGSLNGQNYTISSLFTNRPDENLIGLFGKICAKASLESILLSKIAITGNRWIGGLVGENYGSISNIYVSGKVSGQYEVGGVVGRDVGLLKQIEFIGEVLGVMQAQRVGGLIGVLSGTLTLGVAHANVSGNYRIGGAIGDNQGQADTVYFNGYVTGIRLPKEVGGLVGYNQGTLNGAEVVGTISGEYSVGGVCGFNGGDITFSKFFGEVMGLGSSQDIGGFVGYQSLNGFIANSRASGTVEGKENIGGFAGSNFGALESISFDGEMIGKIQAQWVGGLIGYHGSTGRLIYGRTSGVVSGALVVGGVVGDNYGVISFVEFSGTIIGQIPATYVGGVVGFQDSSGYLSDAKSNATVNGTRFVGGGAGWNLGVLENIIFSGTVIGEKDSSNIGGVVGFNGNTLKNVFIQATIKTQGVKAGGAVGENSYTGTLENVTVIVDLVATNNHAGGVVGNNLGNLFYCRAEGSVQASSDVGGIAGSNGITGIIVYSYAMVNVIAQTNYAGGLIGYHEGVLAFSYSLGPVTANQTAGSLVGYFDGRIQECYAAGCVSAVSQAGGLVGSELAEDQVTEPYWNLDTTGQRYPAGQSYDIILNRNGLTIQQMYRPKSFELWDYDNTWEQQPGKSFPYLKNFTPSVLPTAPTRVCPMEPLPYETWMNSVAIFLGSHFLIVLMTILTRRIQYRNQLYFSFKDAENWVFSMIQTGNLSLMNYLVNEVSQSREYDPEGFNRLELAALSDSTKMIQYWLQKPNASSANLKNVAYAIAQDLHYFETALLLKPDDEAELAMSAGNDAAETGLRSRSINQDDSAITPLLVESGNGFLIDTQLYNAAASGDVRKVKECLIQGAEPNRKNQKGALPIFAATQGRHVNVVLLLIEHGANPFLCNNEQQTIVEFLFSLNLCIVAGIIIKQSRFSLLWSLSKQIHLKALEDKSQYLTEVNLSGYGLSDQEFVRFSAALKHNTVVTEFNVAYNLITVHGLQDSASFLIANQTLSTLDLRCNLITLQGACDFKAMLSGSSFRVILSDNLLLPEDHQDWQSLIATIKFRYKSRSKIFLRIKLIWEHFYFNALMASFLVLASRIASGYLIQAFDKESDHFHFRMTIALLCLSYVPSIYAVHYLYGGWWLRNWRDGVQGVLLLPSLSPELLSYIYQVQSPDITLSLLEIITLSCEILIAALAVSVINYHEDFRPALFKIIVIIILIFYKCLGYIYWRETLKAQWHHWRKSKRGSMAAGRRESQLLQL